MGDKSPAVKMGVAVVGMEFVPRIRWGRRSIVVVQVALAGSAISMVRLPKENSAMGISDKVTGVLYLPLSPIKELPTGPTTSHPMEVFPWGTTVTSREIVSSVASAGVPLLSRVEVVADPEMRQSVTSVTTCTARARSELVALVLWTDTARVWVPGARLGKFLRTVALSPMAGSTTVFEPVLEPTASERLAVRICDSVLPVPAAVAA